MNETLKRAAELLRTHAAELRIAHTLHPYIDLATMEPEVRADYDAEMQTADDLDAMAAQMGESVAWFTDDYLTDKSATTWDKTVAERWKSKGWPVSTLYTIPPNCSKRIAEMEEALQLIVQWDDEGFKLTDPLIAKARAAIAKEQP